MKYKQIPPVLCSHNKPILTPGIGISHLHFSQLKNVFTCTYGIQHYFAKTTWENCSS